MKSESVKALIILLALNMMLGCVYGQSVGNGEPGCQTVEEITVKYYRHFQNKIVYWDCVALGQPAVLQSCPIAHGFLDREKQCVHLSLWYWTPTVAPPSAPVVQPPAQA